MKFSIFKDKLDVLQKLQTQSKIPESILNKSAQGKILQRFSKKSLHAEEDKFLDQFIKPKKEVKIPHFLARSKLDYENDQIQAGVIKDPTAKGGLRYQVIEPVLSEKDQKAFEIIKKLLITELSVSLRNIKSKQDAERRLKKKISSMIKKYHLKIPQRNIEKINYFAIRDFVHLGRIEPLMRDHMIEEISCDGTGIPIYIWHRELESMPTNIAFDKDVELNNFARKTAYICGKHVSMADPIIDAALPDGSRINLTLGHEITKRGSTFTIRRFRSDPITIIDLMKFGTISSEIAAYMWFMTEKNATMLVAGGTASGKTTALNAMATFIKPSQKIVSIEDTQELNLPHENWIPAVSRQNFTDTQIGEINQFDLLRAALRQRPDVIIVGETRGREAYTLFQAMATGHGGCSSIHADSVDATLTRLTSAPMDVPQALISNSLDLITLQLKIRVGDKSVRRVIQISEIDGIDDNTGQIKTHEIFKWNPRNDTHEFMGDSVAFRKISERDGDSQDKINYEITKRRQVLEWMLKNNIRDYKEVSANIMEYSSDPELFFENKKEEQE